MTTWNRGQHTNNNANTIHPDSPLVHPPTSPASLGISPVPKFCDSNLCFNGGRCDPRTQECKCTGHFMGEFLSVLLLLKTHTYKNNRLKIMDKRVHFVKDLVAKRQYFLQPTKTFCFIDKNNGFLTCKHFLWG